MRVSPVGWAFDSLEETLEMAKRGVPSYISEEVVKRLPQELIETMGAFYKKFVYSKLKSNNEVE